MPLPTSREETATAASQVRSTTINVIQDCIIGAKHGDRTLVVPSTSGYGAGTQANGVLTLGGSQQNIPLSLAPGLRLKQITIPVFGNAVADVTAQLFWYKYTGAVSTPLNGSYESLAINDSAAAWTDYVMTVDPQIIVAANENLELVFGAPTAAGVIRIGQLRLLVDNP